ncbi:MAG TPA: DUF177 domain-containing protein [Candidatus Acidoferrales bacterium]|nr:DUF177 domain-containing protein [Candidatus Acidoferrales bacterium]
MTAPYNGFSHLLFTGFVMFLDVHELATKKIRIRKSYAPSTLDFHSGDFRQIDPLEVRATAELIDGQIRIFGTFHTRLELTCARCLDTVVEEVSKDFDLIYRPMASIRKDEEIRLNLDDTDVAFFEGDGLFLADVLAEQVNLSLPMKVICRSDCRGLCPHCGANLNQEECRCETHATDARMAPLARLKQDWPKKQ